MPMSINKAGGSDISNANEFIPLIELLIELIAELIDSFIRHAIDFGFD